MTVIGQWPCKDVTMIWQRCMAYMVVIYLTVTMTLLHNNDIDDMAITIWCMDCLYDNDYDNMVWFVVGLALGGLMWLMMMSHDYFILYLRLNLMNI